MQFKEEALFTLKFDGKPVINELGELEKRLADVKTAQKEVERGTKEWADNKADIKQLEAAIKSVREEMGVSGMTVKQLEGYYRQLNREIKDLTPGTEEYKKKAADLQEVNTALDAHRGNIRAVRDEHKSVWSNVKEYITAAFSVTAIIEAARIVLGFFTDSIKEFRAFESAAKDLSANTGIVGKDLEYLKKQAQELGPAMGKSAADMLEAYKLVGSANSELTKTPVILAEVAKNAVILSQAAKMELGAATASLVGTMNQFNAVSSESGRYMNTLAAGAQAGAAEIDELAASMKTGGTTAKAANLTIEETTGIVASLSKNNIKGAEAGTVLRNVLLTLMAGAKETNPQLVGMETALENLAKKQYSAADMAKLFGKENVTAAMLMVQNRGQIEEFTKAVTGTQAAYQMAKTQTEGFDGQLAKMNSTLKALMVDLGQALVPALTSAVQGVIAFVNIIRAVPEFVRENQTTIAALGIAILALNTNLIAATASSLYYAAVEKSRQIYTASATAAQWLLNAAMTANPIGLIVAGVALLVAGFTTLYNNSQTVRAGINGLWQAMQTAASVVVQFVKAFATMDVKAMADALMNGGTKVADAFNKGYADTLAKERPKIAADHATHVDGKVMKEKDGAAQINTNSQLEHQKELAAKQKAAEAHRQAELKKAAEAAKKEAEEAVKAQNDALRQIETLRIDAIADDLQRSVATIRAKRDREVEAMMASKADAQTKAVWEQALNAQMIRDIEKVEQKHRGDKAKDEEKDRRERDQRERETSKAIAEADYEARHLTLTRQLAAENLNVSQRKTLQLNLIQLEKDETLRKIEAQYAAEKAKLDKEKADAIRTAQEKKQSIETIEAQYRAQYQAAETSRRTKEQKAEDDFQDKKKDYEKKSLEERKKNQQAWFDQIGNLMKGDFTAFSNFLTQKLSKEKSELSASQKANVDKIDKVAGYFKLGVQVMEQLSQMKLQKELKNIESEKQKQLASWKEKYDKGLISKDEYEKGVDKINKDADQKNKAAQLAAFKRQQALDIVMAIINGAQAALKSLAMFGWPLGLIGVAGAIATTAIQIAMIKKQQPPSMTKGGLIHNAGVPDGPGHGSEYGKSGIAMVRRDTGEEVAEMEGGEPVMVLSRNTYTNNKRTVDRLMHSSLHRNGAPIYAEGGIYGEGGSYGDYLRNGGIMFRDGGSYDEYGNYQDNTSVTEGGGSGGGGDSGGSEDNSTTVSGELGTVDTSATGGVEGMASDMDNASYQAQIDESQKVMENIEKNTLATAESVEKANFKQYQLLDAETTGTTAVLIRLVELRNSFDEGFLQLNKTMSVLTDKMTISFPDFSEAIGKLATINLNGFNLLLADNARQFSELRQANNTNLGYLLQELAQRFANLTRHDEEVAQSLITAWTKEMTDTRTNDLANTNYLLKELGRQGEILATDNGKLASAFTAEFTRQLTDLRTANNTNLGYLLQELAQRFASLTRSDETLAQALTVKLDSLHDGTKVLLNDLILNTANTAQWGRNTYTWLADVFMPRFEKLSEGQQTELFALLKALFLSLEKTTHTDLVSLELTTHTDLLNNQRASTTDLTALRTALMTYLDQFGQNLFTVWNTYDTALNRHLADWQTAQHKDFTDGERYENERFTEAAKALKKYVEDRQAQSKEQFEKLTKTIDTNVGDLSFSNYTELQKVQGELGGINQEQQAQTGLLGVISRKELSVQTFVNVVNQIEVVAEKSNLK